MNEKEKLKLKYDYEKTWLLPSISLFITTAIGMFTVSNLLFKVALITAWFISIILFFYYYRKVNKTYNKLMK